MLFSLYGQKILTALFGGLFIALGVYTFDDAVLFDRISIFILLFVAILCRKDVNVLGVVLIFIAGRLLDETAWNIMLASGAYGSKFIFYALAAFIFFFTKYDRFSYCLITALLLSISIDIFTLVKQGTELNIQWYIFQITLVLTQRHCLLYRLPYTESLYPKETRSLHVDWQLYKAEGIAILLLTAMVIEYFIRHIFQLSDFVYIYNAFAHLNSIILIYIIWCIFNQSYKILLSNVKAF